MHLILSFLKRISVSQKIILVTALIAVFTGCFYALGSWFTFQQRSLDLRQNLAEQNKIALLTIGTLATQLSDSDPETSTRIKSELEKNLQLQISNLNLIREGGMYKKHLLPAANKEVLEKLTSLDTAFIAYQKNVEVLISQSPQMKVPGDSVMRANAAFTEALKFVQKEFLSGKLNTSYDELIAFAGESSSGNQQAYYIFLVILIGLTLGVLGGGFYLLNACIAKPVDRLSKAMDVLSKGNSNISINYSATDEFGRLANSVNTLAKNLKKATAFTLSMENGDFSETLVVENEEYANADENFALALNKMKLKLLTVSDLERIRVWNSEGLAKFAEIQRLNQTLDDFGKAIISELVRFTHTYQGGFYIVKDSNPKNISIELSSCFAMGSQQNVHTEIKPGEGLVGQSYLLKEKIFLDKIPDSYVSISSGLGESKPACILIIPFLYNGEVQGMLELASFTVMKEYQVKFVEEIAGNIGAIVYSFKSNDKTRTLLEETQAQAEMMMASEKETESLLFKSQEQTEELRAQEEELRQNMEELNATQEEISNVLRDVQAKEQYLKELINISTDSIFTIDHDYKIISYNNTFSKALEAMGLTDLKGFDFLNLFPDETQKEKQKELYDRVLAGESFEQMMNYETEEGTSYYTSSYAPIRNQEGEVVAASCFAKDITKLVTAQKEAELLLQESQAQSEMLLIQEEETQQQLRDLKKQIEDSKKQHAALELKMNALENSNRFCSIEFDTQGNIVYANASLLDLFGYQLEEVLNKPHSILVDPEYAQTPEYKTYWSDVLNGKVKSAHIKCRTRAGASIKLSESYSILDGKGAGKKLWNIAYVVE